MATTSARALTLLTLLGTRPSWSGSELAERLGTSVRTLRRDVGTLRSLGYPVEAGSGPHGGYRLVGGRLPPLVLDDDQAVAVALALRTAPVSVVGLQDDAARALTTLTATMPPALRARADALPVTTARNFWELSLEPPLAPRTLQVVGAAVRDRRTLRVEVLGADGARAVPGSPGFVPPAEVEPHHLVLWGGRWYLVVFDPADDRGWRVLRVDTLHVGTGTGSGRPVRPRELPVADAAELVVTSHDRGDRPDRWPCVGSAVLDLAPEVVARWAPGGAAVEPVDEGRCRLVLGAWSWTAVAALLATFGTELHQVRPAELVRACERVSGRLARAAGGADDT